MRGFPNASWCTHGCRAIPERITTGAGKLLHAHGRPPRVRGRQQELYLPLAGERMTPACAGTTGPWRIGVRHPWDDPRVCGDDRMGGYRSVLASG